SYVPAHPEGKVALLLCSLSAFACFSRPMFAVVIGISIKLFASSSVCLRTSVSIGHNGNLELLRKSYQSPTEGLYAPGATVDSISIPREISTDSTFPAGCIAHPPARKTRQFSADVQLERCSNSAR